MSEAGGGAAAETGSAAQPRDASPVGGGDRRRIAVIAIGEPERGDDAIGPRVAALLEPGLPGDVRLVAVRALEVEALLSLEEDEACILIDAVAGPTPGTVVVRPLPEVAGAAGVGARSTHVLPVNEVLGMAAILRPGLPEGVFVGLAGHGWALGSGLSPEVEAALPLVVERIRREVGRLREAP